VTTLTELITAVSRDLRDTNNNAFTTAMVTDLINSAITELSRITPQPFQEDIAATGDQTYVLTATGRKVSATRVEIWDTTPPKFRYRVPFASESNVNSSEAGWRVFNGTLEFPYNVSQFALTDAYTIRVWGYKPWTHLVNGGDTTDLDEDAQDAMRECAVFHGFERLLNERVLFAQWQQQANNTDVSTAGLINAVGLWQARWDRRRKQLAEMRELP
jgi:hypothetical protein